MFNEKTKRSALGRFRGVLFIALLVFCGAAICWAWHYHRHAASMAIEADGLIRSLAESVSAIDGSATQIRVALFDANLDDGSATKDLKRLLDTEPTFAWETLNPTDIQPGGLEAFDVVIFPGGNARRQAAAIGADGKEIVQEFVRDGGGYVGICGGAYLATAKYDWGMALVNAKPLTGQMDIPGEEVVSITARGAGIVKMELTDTGKTVLGEWPGLLSIKYTGGPILSLAGMRALPEYVSLAVFRTEVWEYEPQRGTMVDTPAIVAGRFGKGRVIIFSPHPEMTEGLESLVRRAIAATARMRSVHGSP